MRDGPGAQVGADTARGRLLAFWRVLHDAFADSLAAPLSVRQVRLVLAMLDMLPAHAFAGFRSEPGLVDGAEDLPAYRSRLAQRAPALRLIFEGGEIDGGSRLRLGPMPVTEGMLMTLPVEDFMVSLYNDNTVQRVFIGARDGSLRLAHEVLGEAMAWWEGEMERLGRESGGQE